MSVAQSRQSSREHFLHFVVLQVAAQMWKEAPEGQQRKRKEDKVEEIEGISGIWCWLKGLTIQILDTC